MAKGISEDEVHEAADALLEEGQRPTIERVRQKLGRGSPNTVNRYMDSWWKALSTRLKGTGKAGKMPAEVVRLAGRLWALALAKAEEVQAQSPRFTKPPDPVAALGTQLAELKALLEPTARVKALEREVNAMFRRMQSKEARTATANLAGLPLSRILAAGAGNTAVSKGGGTVSKRSARKRR